jgi:hypothetical protein
VKSFLNDCVTSLWCMRQSLLALMTLLNARRTLTVSHVAPGAAAAATSLGTAFSIDQCSAMLQELAQARMQFGRQMRKATPRR